MTPGTSWKCAVAWDDSSWTYQRGWRIWTCWRNRTVAKVM